ncbi:TetR family transcriptional regulator [Serratia fonticola]|uniref:TetR family transcriptional regulator n=1 Tax=Serratia fonticola TaxID=47917 RepID=UPI003AAC9988
MARKKKEYALITRQRILDEALRMFSNQGVTSTSLSDIAKAAGVTRGAIYWHFANKECIIEEIFFQFEMAKSVHIAPFYSMLRKDPLLSLRNALIKTLYVIRHDERQAQIMSLIYCKREMLEGCTSAGYIRKNIYFNGGDVASAFKKCVNHGALPAGFDVEKNAIMIMAFMAGIIESWLLDPMSFDLYQDGEKAILGYLSTIVSSRSVATEA